jgi:hypothetical protein
MPVPRERKKLDRSAAAKNTVMARPVEQAIPTAPASNLKTRSLQKLDKAFEIMEQVPYRESGATEAASPQSQRLGFRWKISLEAVLPEDTNADSKGPASNPDRTTLLNLGFTVPFFWGWPIVDEITKNFLKYFKPYRIPNLF